MIGGRRVRRATGSTGAAPRHHQAPVLGASQGPPVTASPTAG